MPEDLEDGFIFSNSDGLHDLDGVYRNGLLAAKKYCLSCHVKCLRRNLIICGGGVRGRVASVGGISCRGLEARMGL